MESCSPGHKADHKSAEDDEVMRRELVVVTWIFRQRLCAVGGKVYDELPAGFGLCYLISDYYISSVRVTCFLRLVCSILTRFVKLVRHGRRTLPKRLLIGFGGLTTTLRSGSSTPDDLTFIPHPRSNTSSCTLPDLSVSRPPGCNGLHCVSLRAILLSHLHVSVLSL